MKRSLGIALVLWIFCVSLLCFHVTALADEALAARKSDRYRWHLRAGMQVAHQNPDFLYTPVDPDEVKGWNSNRDRPLTAFSFVSLQRELTDDSNIELAYITDGTDGKVHGTGRVKLGFFYLYPSPRDPLEIDVRTLKLTYSRALWQPEPFSLGASVSVQAMQVSMNADLSKLLMSMVGYDHFDYLVVAPSVGVFAEYRTKGPLTYRFSSEWMSVPLGDVEGKLIEFSAVAEYQLTERFFLGAGYRFSDRNVRIHEDDHEIKGSYEIHGYQLYAGLDF
ncbi:hypothetical protein EST62_02805 [Chlorobaculum sp. 24CR]|uniref:hypothetical protein n=1 Tax=Chlorobaculum sp. 24CR TaxID=2508878 RepID=UPI0010283F3E|nr:hypothetical protein [Chlorobaculum sp. 24CR]RXK88457.1 hypothetical protein EST62_02805 [Chlorobaculum sp. 24CR]